MQTTWNDGDSLDYYALRVAPMREFAARDVLANAGILAKVPVYKSKPKSRHRKVCDEIEIPSFTGLVFAAFDRAQEISWWGIKQLPLIKGVIGMNHIPSKLDHAGLMRMFDDIVFSDAEIEAVMQRKPADFEVRSEVRFLYGSFAGIHGFVEEATETELRVLCDIFGRQTQMRVKAADLDLLESVAA